MASIYKRQKTWTANVAYTIHGQTKRKTKSGFLTKVEAQNWSNKIEAQKSDGTLKNLDTKTLFSDYYQEWYTTFKTSKEKNTIRQYAYSGETIAKYFDGVKLNNVSRLMIQQFINDFGKNHAQTTVKKRTQHIKAALRDAYADGLISTDPTQRLELLYNKDLSKSKADKFLELDDANKLIALISDKNTLDDFLILTGILSGARFGELIALTDDDIDVDNKTIDINKAYDPNHHEFKPTKNPQSNRIIDMPDIWIDQYKRYTHDGTRLFDITNAGINSALKTRLKAINAKQVTFHALRHTHASMLLTGDISMLYVSERLGHANIAVTQQVYAHLLQDKRDIERNKTIDLLNKSATNLLQTK